MRTYRTETVCAIALLLSAAMHRPAHGCGEDACAIACRPVTATAAVEPRLPLELNFEFSRAVCEAPGVDNEARTAVENSRTTESKTRLDDGRLESNLAAAKEQESVNRSNLRPAPRLSFAFSFSEYVKDMRFDMRFWGSWPRSKRVSNPGLDGEQFLAEFAAREHEISAEGEPSKPQKTNDRPDDSQSFDFACSFSRAIASSPSEYEDAASKPATNISRLDLAQVVVEIAEAARDSPIYETQGLVTSRLHFDVAFSFSRLDANGPGDISSSGRRYGRLLRFIGFALWELSEDRLIAELAERERSIAADMNSKMTQDDSTAQAQAGAFKCDVSFSDCAATTSHRQTDLLGCEQIAPETKLVAVTDVCMRFEDEAILSDDGVTYTR